MSLQFAECPSSSSPARIIHFPFNESWSSLVTLLCGGEGDDLSMWKLCSLCQTQGSALLLWRHPGQLFHSSQLFGCVMFLFCEYSVPIILTSLFFWRVCIYPCNLNLLFSHPFFQDYVVLKLWWLRESLWAAGIAAELSTTGGGQRV